MIVVVGTNSRKYDDESDYLWQKTVAWLLQQKHEVSISIPHLGPFTKGLEKLQKAGAVFNHRKPGDVQQFKTNRLMKFQRWVCRSPRLFTDQKALEWIIKRKPQLVVVNHLENRSRTWWMEKMAQTDLPFVNIVHSNESDSWLPNDSITHLLSGFHAAKCNYFPSKNSIRQMEIQLGTNIPKVRLFEDCRGVSYKQDSRWPEDGKMLRLAMIAGPDARVMGHEMVFDILTREAWRNRAIELNIYGEGSTSKSVQRLTRLRNLSQVHFHGEIKRREMVWQKNHFLLKPSRLDGSPCSLMESMLCARGAIVTDVGANRDFVEEGVSGFVASYPRTESLEEALERCWQRRGDAREIGLAARRKAEEMLPVEPEAVLGQKLLDLISSSV